MPARGSGLELMSAGPIYEPAEHDDFFNGQGYYRWRFSAVSPGTETIDGIFAMDGCDRKNAKRFTLTVHVAEGGVMKEPQKNPSTCRKHGTSTS
jgi:predicted secreted protein